MENQIDQLDYLYFTFFLKEFYSTQPDVLVTLIAMASVFIRLSLHTFNTHVNDMDAIKCIVGVLFRKLCYINICLSNELMICDPDVPVPISLSLCEEGYNLMYSSNAYLCLAEKIYSCPVRNDLLRHIQMHTRYLTGHFKRLTNSVSVHDLILLSMQASSMDKLLNQRFRYIVKYTERQYEVIEFPIREPVYTIKTDTYKRYMEKHSPEMTQGCHTLKTFITKTKSVLRGKMYGKKLTTAQIIKEIEETLNVKEKDVIYSLFGRRSLYWPILKNLEVVDFHTQWNSNHAEIRTLTFSDVTEPQDDDISILSDAMEE